MVVVVHFKMDGQQEITLRSADTFGNKSFPGSIVFAPAAERTDPPPCQAGLRGPRNAAPDTETETAARVRAGADNVNRNSVVEYVTIP